jgi:hypothetical protein
LTLSRPRNPETAGLRVGRFFRADQGFPERRTPIATADTGLLCAQYAAGRDREYQTTDTPAAIVCDPSQVLDFTFRGSNRGQFLQGCEDGYNVAKRAVDNPASPLAGHCLRRRRDRCGWHRAGCLLRAKRACGRAPSRIAHNPRPNVYVSGRSPRPSGGPAGGTSAGFIGMNAIRPRSTV